VLWRGEEEGQYSGEDLWRGSGNKKGHYHHGDPVMAKNLNQRERQASA
jgi:hypothetical protein